jgi:hypothetical protein
VCSVVRIRFTIDITRHTEQPEHEAEMGTTASQVELDGQPEAGELKAPKLQEPTFGYRARA